MGYTHYWDFHDREALQRIWPQLVKDIRLIIEKANISLEGIDSVDETKDLDLNGDYKQHDPFCFGPGMRSGFNFCKTAYKEYDLVVCAILLRATQLLPSSVLQVSSDGHWDEWKKPADLIRKLWPCDPVECPWGSGEDE